MTERFRFFAERRDYGLSVALHIAMIGESGRVEAVGFPIVFDTEVDGKDAPPAIEIRQDDAQGLLDELWRCGFRPTQQPEGDGIKAHLEDMRAIAFGKLNLAKPSGSK